MTSSETGLFDRLRQAAGRTWSDYVEHPFVTALGDGSLPPAAFRCYLMQDFLFLTHFARAYGLAGFKATGLPDLRAASEGLAAILGEIPLHIAFGAEWGLSEATMAAEPEAIETVAYTRFLLDIGGAGDLLDLYVGFAACVLGYAEIGRRLGSKPLDGNPYRHWIEMYAGAEYQATGKATSDTLDRLWAERGGPNRLASLQANFDMAVRLEAGFWQMGLRAAAGNGTV